MANWFQLCSKNVQGKLTDGPRVFQLPRNVPGQRRLLRSKSLLVMGMNKAEGDRDSSKSGWSALSNAVFTGLVSPAAGFHATVLKAEQKRLYDLLQKRPDVRNADELRFLRRFFMGKAADWPFLNSKHPQFYEELAKLATLETRSTDETIFKENVSSGCNSHCLELRCSLEAISFVVVQDRANCMYLIIDGSVALYASSPPEEDSGTGAAVDWSAMRNSLSAVQRSLDSVKHVADIQSSSELKSIRKPDPPASSTEPELDKRASPKSTVVVYTETREIDARRTWGRVLGGLQLAAVLSTAAEELEKSVRKGGHQVSKAAIEATQFLGFARTGEAFGDNGLLERRPGNVSLQCFRRMYDDCALVSMASWIPCSAANDSDCSP